MERFSIGSFKADFEEYGADDIIKQFKHIRRLAFEYIHRAKRQSRDTKNRWILYLKAHALLNSSILRCGPDEVLKLKLEQELFDLENDWYDGKHRLRNVDSLRSLTREHKAKLRDIRDSNKTGYSNCGKLIKEIKMDDIFSEHNANIAETFSEQVKCQSDHCTQEMINFAKMICEKSEALVVGRPPCRYAIIALGSIARNEVTPYSDLEYAFLIEPGCDKTYFTNLAVDTYFRISNLGETPLKYYHIEELHDNYKSQSKVAKEKLWFIDKAPSGFKIDGLSRKAGNIPTGNCYTKESLIVTVIELMNRYVSSLDVEEISKEACLADLLVSTVLVHSHDDRGQRGCELLDDFRREKRIFEANLEGLTIGNEKLVENRVRRLIMDVKGFNYCPGNLPEDMRNLQVKTDIFRYPTILAHNLKITLNLESCGTAWDVFQHLHLDRHFISKEILEAIQFVLMSAVWIRNSAYLCGGTQRESLSFYPKYGDGEIDDRFFVPKKLYIAMACRLVPIKQSVLNFVPSDTDTENLDLSGIEIAFRNIHIDKTDGLLQSRLHYICGDYQEGLNNIHHILNRDIPEVPDHLEPEFKSNTEEAVQLIAYLLFHNGDFAKAVNYFEWLSQQPNDYSREKLVYFASLFATKAQCLMMLGRYTESQTVFDKAGDLIERLLGAENKTDVYLKLARMLCEKQNGTLPKKDEELILAACVNSRFIANSVRYHQGRYEKTQESFNNLKLTFLLVKALMLDDERDSLVVADFEMSIGLYYLQLAKYKEAKQHLSTTCRIYTKVFGASAATIDQSAIQVHLGTLSLRCADYAHAEELGLSSLKIIEETDQRYSPDHLPCHQLLAEVYLHTGKYQQSRQHQEICQQIIATSRAHGYVLSNAVVSLTDVQLIYHQALAETNQTRKVSQLENAKLLVVGIIERLKETVNKKAVESHPEMAVALRTRGQICLTLNQLNEAKLHAEKALQGFQRAYGNTIHHPDISKTYLVLGQIGIGLHERTVARNHISNAITGLLTVYGDSCNHPVLAEAWYLFSELEANSGNYQKALDMCAKSLHMTLHTFGWDSFHPTLLKYTMHFVMMFLTVCYIFTFQ